MSELMQVFNNTDVFTRPNFSFVKGFETGKPDLQRFIIYTKNKKYTSAKPLIPKNFTDVPSTMRNYNEFDFVILVDDDVTKSLLNTKNNGYNNNCPITVLKPPALEAFKGTILNEYVEYQKSVGTKFKNDWKEFTSHLIKLSHLSSSPAKCRYLTYLMPSKFKFSTTSSILLDLGDTLDEHQMSKVIVVKGLVKTDNPMEVGELNKHFEDITTLIRNNVGLKARVYEKVQGLLPDQYENEYVKNRVNAVLKIFR